MPNTYKIETTCDCCGKPAHRRTPFQIPIEINHGTSMCKFTIKVSLRDSETEEYPFLCDYCYETAIKSMNGDL